MIIDYHTLDHYTLADLISRIIILWIVIFGLSYSGFHTRDDQPSYSTYHTQDHHTRVIILVITDYHTLDHHTLFDLISRIIILWRSHSGRTGGSLQLEIWMLIYFPFCASVKDNLVSLDNLQSVSSAAGT